MTSKSSLVIFCAIIIGFIAYWVFIYPLQKNYDVRHINIHGIYLLNAIPVEQLELVDQNGKPFTKENLQNHWSLLFFGFTHCDMVCPVTLSSLNQFYRNIENKLTPKELPQIVFITIDPERDTTERLKKYLSQFNPHFIGARTSLEKTEEMKKQFHIMAEKAKQKPDQYNHSTEILLINPKAEIQAYFSFPHDPVQLEQDYKAIIKHSQKPTA